ncbi:MAG TPA: alpha/beta hydrolase [Burkholderiales bacterium]|nr:alpha/beta hydrolase [Burkholderiales bacterium]
MKPSRSTFLQIRGLRYHVREWGGEAAPKLFFLHGWMDVSASFQFAVDALKEDWHVLAPDWRGFGLTEWARGGYWFPDYVADLDALLDRLCPDGPAKLVGHSMGGNVAGLYAGIRPERVEKLVLAEGFGLPPAEPDRAPRRYAQWLEEIRDPPQLKTYASFEEVEARLRRNNPRLSASRAQFLARHWAEEKAPGRIELRADPLHKMVNPVLYRVEEAMACWRCIAAPTLWLHGDGAWLRGFLKGDEASLDSYRAAYCNLCERRIDDAGHMMHHERPEAFAAAIEDFLRAAAGTSGSR